MLKIFLVEDEFIVREGIKNNIDWAANGFEFCGEASDGEVAFPMIQKIKPDIVITDIKMPFMDGLELSKLIKKELPWTEIIILTGHEKFEYAKEAIKIGVAEYLSKPISSSELLREVSNLAIKIEEKKKEREIKEKYRLEMEENLMNEKKDLFQYLVTGQKSMSELFELADKMGINLSALWYNIILFDIKSLKHKNDEYANDLIEIEKRLKDIAGGEHLITFGRNLEGTAVLVKADSEEELETISNDYLGKMENIFKDYSDIKFFVGVGTKVNRLSELKISFEKASRLFAHRFFEKENKILKDDIQGQNAYVEDSGFNISNIDTKQIDRSKIGEFLKIGAKDEAVYFVEEFFKDLSKSVMESSIFRQYIIMDAYFSVVSFVESIGQSKDEIEPLEVNSEAFVNAQNATGYVIKIIGQALELREKVASNRYDDIVSEVIKYIDENYAEDELSLNTVASHVNFSPNHLSTIFSQQTGQTFIKYLTDYRMNKAKELLRCTGKRSSAIALEVGYKDPHYFSYLFKKTQNMTPTQYRGGKAAEGED